MHRRERGERGKLQLAVGYIRAQVRRQLFHPFTEQPVLAVPRRTIARIEREYGSLPPPAMEDLQI